MTINIIDRPPRRRLSLFHLFRAVPGTFQPLLACYGLFRVVPFFTSNGATGFFDLQLYYESTLCRLYYKELQASL